MTSLSWFIHLITPVNSDSFPGFNLNNRFMRNIYDVLTCSPPRCPLSVGHLMASLYDLLLEAGVQATFADKLRDDGWTVELFGMAAASLDKFDDELKDILGDLHDITTAVQRSAFRLAWTRCQTNLSTPSALANTPMANSSESASAPTSWSETFPPKLTAQIVTEMKQKFRKHYPAEVLLPETMPSLRLLSLVHHQKSKSEFRWVPWKYRLSQFKADELSSAKPTRIWQRQRDSSFMHYWWIHHRN